VTEVTIGSLVFNFICFTISVISFSMLMQGDYRKAQGNDALFAAETVLLIATFLTGGFFYMLSLAPPPVDPLDQYYVLLIPLVSAILAVLAYRYILVRRRAKAQRLEMERKIEARLASVAKSEGQYLRK